MLFKDINRLLTIEKYGSFSKAADELFISRSALTQQIKQLEKELGFIIFDRNHKGVSLTKEGTYFINEIQQLQSGYDKTIDYCRRNQHMVQDFIVIGVMPNLKSPFLSIICKEFRQQYPLVEIRFRDYFLKDYEAKFKAKEFDISVEYFFNYNHSLKEIEGKKLLTTTHSLHVVPDHPLAHNKSIRFEDLRGHKLIMYRQGVTKSEDMLREYLQNNEPEITIIDINTYDSSLFTTCELDKAVLLTYSPYHFSQFIQIPAAWNIPVELGFCYHKDRRPIVNDFIVVAESVIQTHSF